MNRLSTIVAIAMSLLSTSALAETGSVFRTPSCGCCHKWVEHMAGEGFTLTVTDMAFDDLATEKQRLGVAGKYASCHTARIAGYVIEGHVPAADVKKLLELKPDAIGLSVPGMPSGSPGMEANGQRDAFDVLLVKKDGSSDIFTHYAAQSLPAGGR